MNFPNLTPRAETKLHNAAYSLDADFIGTPDYMGIAYFWHHDYRHYLRDCKNQIRQKVHKDFLKNHLILAGESEKHLEIIRRHTGKF